MIGGNHSPHVPSSILGQNNPHGFLPAPPMFPSSSQCFPPAPPMFPPAPQGLLNQNNYTQAFGQGILGSNNLPVFPGSLLGGGGLSQGLPGGILGSNNYFQGYPGAVLGANNFSPGLPTGGLRSNSFNTSLPPNLLGTNSFGQGLTAGILGSNNFAQTYPPYGFGGGFSQSILPALLNPNYNFSSLMTNSPSFQPGMVGSNGFPSSGLTGMFGSHSIYPDLPPPTLGASAFSQAPIGCATTQNVFASTLDSNRISPTMRPNFQGSKP